MLVQKIRKIFEKNASLCNTDVDEISSCESHDHFKAVVKTYRESKHWPSDRTGQTLEMKLKTERGFEFDFNFRKNTQYETCKKTKSRNRKKNFLS